MQTISLRNSKTMDYSHVLGSPKTRKEVLLEIESCPISKEYFQTLSSQLQEELIAFCMGVRGLKLTYDPIFRFLFNPELHPERLAEILTLILGEEVEIIAVLPNESDRFTESAALLITDIVVRLASGAYANVEIQRVGYNFPGQRCSCYSSDLLMRQLTRARNAAKTEKRKFSYGDLKKVYTIVFVAESSAVYWKHPNEYIHYGKQQFNTGLELELLQEFIIIPLDVFREIPHNEFSKLEAWLYCIGSDEPKDICRVVEAYPEFRELYKELVALRYDMKGLTGMYEDYFRQMLREADEEAWQYMVEEQKKQIDEQAQYIDNQKKQIDEQAQQIDEQAQQIDEQAQQIDEQKKQIDEQANKIKEYEKILAVQGK